VEDIMKESAQLLEMGENMCPECGSKMFNGGTASYLRWCEDPNDNYECLYCEDCGLVHIPNEGAACKLEKTVLKTKGSENC